MTVADSSEAAGAVVGVTLPVADYDLGGTLDSGQAFRWIFDAGRWWGVIGPRWVRLQSVPGAIVAETVPPVHDWTWLTHYLQVDVDLAAVVSTFPDDPPMQAAVAACRGLRLLRQDPWECLASFILSSTKQIVQIRQVIAALCSRFGESLPVPPGCAAAWAFPTAAQLAARSEEEIRRCKAGFRAPYLLAAARAVADGTLDLSRLASVPMAEARRTLMSVPGVGGKVADCALLFSLGFGMAFPVDVWVDRAVRELYFRNRQVKPARLKQFTTEHFGPHSGYAQQYLFHHARLQSGPRRGNVPA